MHLHCCTVLSPASVLLTCLLDEAGHVCAYCPLADAEVDSDYWRQPADPDHVRTSVKFLYTHKLLALNTSA